MRDTGGEAGGTEKAMRGRGSVEAEGKGDSTGADGDNSAGVVAGVLVTEDDVLAAEDSVVTVNNGTCKGVSERGSNICEGEEFSVREEEEELTFCAAKGKVNSAKTTSRDIYNLPMGIWRHL